MWFFFSANIAYGDEALNFLENIPGSKCFIVTDKILEEIGIVKILTDRLDSLGRQYEIYADVKPDPHEEDILKGKEVCIAYGPDLIIALGGGSVMDSGKSIWAMYEYPEYGIDDIHPFNPDFYNLGKKAKMLCIPTTSGTGAECTWAVVVSRKEDDGWIKLEQAHKGIVPQYAILDPVFPAKMPPKLTAATAFDALAHSLESICSGWKNEFSDPLGLKAVELIFKYLPDAYDDGTNMEARNFMHQAATISGLCFGNSQAHIGHSLGHTVGAVFHIPHGNAVGLFLPYVIQFCINNPDENDDAVQILGKFAKQLGWAKWDDDDKQAANNIVKKVQELQKRVNLPQALKDLGVSKEDLDNNMDTLIKLCLQSACTSMCPRSTSAEDFKRIFEYSFEGKDIDF
jgi:acetaldehyde dehydrogenase/alcohol dehydrogenase